jgi:hypothetical protein
VSRRDGAIVAWHEVLGTGLFSASSQALRAWETRHEVPGYYRAGPPGQNTIEAILPTRAGNRIAETPTRWYSEIDLILPPFNL